MKAEMMSKTKTRRSIVFVIVGVFFCEGGYDGVAFRVVGRGEFDGLDELRNIGAFHFQRGQDG